MQIITIFLKRVTDPLASGLLCHTASSRWRDIGVSCLVTARQCCLGCPVCGHCQLIPPSTPKSLQAPPSTVSVDTRSSGPNLSDTTTSLCCVNNRGNKAHTHSLWRPNPEMKSSHFSQILAFGLNNNIHSLWWFLSYHNYFSYFWSSIITLKQFVADNVMRIF